MEQGQPEKALSLLHDYLITLRDSGDKTEVNSDLELARLPADERKRKAIQMEKPGLISASSQRTIKIADRWMNSVKMPQWTREGRITDDGVLRVNIDKQRPYTISKVWQVWPHLKYWDTIGLLIILDGTLEGMEMDAKENVRAVIEEIVELKIAAFFGGLLTGFRKTKAPEATTAEPAAKTKRAWRQKKARAPYRVRHPKTGQLVTREELRAYEASVAQRKEAVNA